MPYERIQDVSLEAKLVPRVLGLVAVRFETGAGGADDLALKYLTVAEGERLRRLVRARREDEPAVIASADPSIPSAEQRSEEGEVLFAMGPRRLLLFGLFSFSLAVFAVLGGALQYLDTFTGIEVWNVDLWRSWLDEQGNWVARLGPLVQAIGALAGVLALVLIGTATGIATTFARDWGFTLTRSPRGFRRQRGLFTRTDVVMPVHRVQAVAIDTGLLRYRFGWRALSFVSLAQDAGNSSHVVAPFARIEEIAPIVASAGFRLPDGSTDWHRASKRHRTDGAILDSLAFFLAVVPVAIFAPPGFAVIPFAAGMLAIGANLYSWKFRRHAVDGRHVYASHGLLSPNWQVATRMKLHSVEIAQGPIARRRGYATVHLGLAGGELALRGVPLAEARALRTSLLETIAGTDYSQLEGLRDQTLRPAQSGFSSNLAAT